MMVCVTDDTEGCKGLFVPFVLFVLIAGIFMNRQPLFQLALLVFFLTFLHTKPKLTYRATYRAVCLSVCL